MEAPLEARPVWSEILPLLATEPIPVVAARFQLSPGAIASAIKRSGLTRRAVVREDLEENSVHREDDAMLDEPVVAAGPPSTAPAPYTRKPSKVEAFHAIVGVESDSEVARRANVSRKTVREYRARHKIPAAGPKLPQAAAASEAQRRTGLRSPIDAVAHLIGTMPDSALAKQVGVSRGALYQYRARRGLPGYAAPAAAPRSDGAEARQQAPEAPSRATVAVTEVLVTAAPTPAPAAGTRREAGGRSFAYTAIVRKNGGDQAYIVIGSDIREACARASDAADGEIVAVTLHLEALV